MNITDLARQSIKHFLSSGERLGTPRNLPPELSRPAGAFVSLHAVNGELRGCIGTTSPTTPNLASEVISNAISAATQDDRFNPVELHDLANLWISVDVLGRPVPEPDLSKLDPQRFGIVVSASDGRTGVLLPDLENINSAAEQIAICREKGAIDPEEPVHISKFEVKRFQEHPQPDSSGI